LSAFPGEHSEHIKTPKNLQDALQAEFLVEASLSRYRVKTKPEHASLTMLASTLDDRFPISKYSGKHISVYFEPASSPEHMEGEALLDKTKEA